MSFTDADVVRALAGVIVSCTSLLLVLFGWFIRTLLTRLASLDRGQQKTERRLTRIEAKMGIEDLIYGRRRDDDSIE